MIYEDIANMLTAVGSALVQRILNTAATDGVELNVRGLINTEFCLDVSLP